MINYQWFTSPACAGNVNAWTDSVCRIYAAYNLIYRSDTEVNQFATNIIHYTSRCVSPLTPQIQNKVLQCSLVCVSKTVGDKHISKTSKTCRGETLKVCHKPMAICRNNKYVSQRLAFVLTCRFGQAVPFGLACIPCWFNLHCWFYMLW